MLDDDGSMRVIAVSQKRTMHTSVALPTVWLNACRSLQLSIGDSFLNIDDRDTTVLCNLLLYGSSDELESLPAKRGTARCK